MKLKVFFLVTAFSALLFSCNKDSGNKSLEVTTPTSDADKISYSMGYDIGNSFLQTLMEDSVHFELNYLYRGIADGLNAKDSSIKKLMTPDEMAEVMEKFQQQMQEKQQAKMAERQAKYEARAKTAKEDGEKFLAENKNKSGVKTTKSGLQYKIITEGKGAIPKSNDMVKIHIVGKFIDGEEFQNTYVMSDAPEILLKDLNIKSWVEAITMMPVGSKWEIYSPAHLAYGSQDTGVIPPNSAVIFIIELIDIVKNQEEHN